MRLSNVRIAERLTRHHGPALQSAVLWANVNARRWPELTLGDQRIPDAEQEIDYMY